eukprot:6479554-Pyramimonas_sp.AAC.1
MCSQVQSGITFRVLPLRSCAWLCVSRASHRRDSRTLAELDAELDASALSWTHVGVSLRG